MPQQFDDGCDVLMDAPMARRGKAIMLAMADAWPERVRVIHSYTGQRQRRLLMIYGAGLPARQAIVKQHQRAGGRVLMWDIGYWQRDDHMRLSVDRMHPSTEHLAMAPAEPRRHRLTLREDANPAGPIMIVGIGPKSCAMLGLAHHQWERRQVQRLAREYPGRRVLLRPKGRDTSRLAGTELVAGGSIEQALLGCSLVVTRHSNVAIDAAIAGIPVQCEDGAALALYRHGSNPTPAQRADFLARLSWFNWSPGEAYKAWTWIWRLTE